MVARIRHLVEREQPDIIFTFDPRYGDTCHAEHRVLGSLVISIVRAMKVRPKVYLSETSIDQDPVVPNDPAQRGYDATEPSAAGGATWQHYVTGASVYENVLSGIADKIARTPASRRKVYLLEMDQVREGDRRYAICGGG